MRANYSVGMENKINVFFCWNQSISGIRLRNKQSENTPPSKQKKTGSFPEFYFQFLETTYNILTTKNQNVQSLGQINVLV